ncbi:MAG: radical SAM/Cys-rich domain protein [Gemmataceae bacterium]|nr:radical SAM/Cys-rich domain protein [Gemmataceae bacterium]
MAGLTLVRSGSKLARPESQRWEIESLGLPHFRDTLTATGQWPLRAGKIEILQVNLGKLCNQTCAHCHVDAGPDRREIMSMNTLRLCLDVLCEAQIPVLDLTGGAPEMNPHFRWAVEQAANLGKRIIDRSNLTILLSPGFQDLPQFLARHQVEITASLPCYLEENTDLQRGNGVFQKSIQALRILNELGYGQESSPLNLTLVFNPTSNSLPPRQEKLEEDYREALWGRYGVVFNKLITITNMPISRFLSGLIEKGQHQEYMQKLVENYNPATVKGLMCRNTLSVGWDGALYDCDFNQMLDLPLAPDQSRHISEFMRETLERRQIVTGQHCYGCTAGSGSGCQGAIANGRP